MKQHRWGSEDRLDQYPVTGNAYVTLHFNVLAVLLNAQSCHPNLRSTQKKCVLKLGDSITCKWTIIIPRSVPSLRLRLDRHRYKCTSEIESTIILVSQNQLVWS